MTAFLKSLESRSNMRTYMDRLHSLQIAGWSRQTTVNDDLDYRYKVSPHSTQRNDFGVKVFRYL